eukprot:gene11679-11768_t
MKAVSVKEIKNLYQDKGKEVIFAESAALQQLALALDETFDEAIEMIRATKGHLIVSGVGKSGHKQVMVTLEWQLNDPYVQQAQSLGYRSRAAFKILDIDQKFKLFKSGSIVVDLGAAPGGWTQVALRKVGDKGQADVVLSDMAAPASGMTDVDHIRIMALVEMP